MFLHRLLYLYQFQFTIQHTIVLYWATHRCKMVYECGKWSRMTAKSWDLPQGQAPSMWCHFMVSWVKARQACWLAEHILSQKLLMRDILDVLSCVPMYVELVMAAHNVGRRYHHLNTMLTKATFFTFPWSDTNNSITVTLLTNLHIN